MIGLHSDLINVGMVAHTVEGDGPVQVRRAGEGLVWTSSATGPFRVQVCDVQGRILFTTTPHVGAARLAMSGIAAQVLVWRAVGADGTPIAQGRVSW